MRERRGGDIGFGWSKGAREWREEESHEMGPLSFFIKKIKKR